MLYVWRGFAALFFCCACFAPAYASPWGQSPREGLTITKLDHYRASDDARRFAQTSLETYAEFGLTPDWTVGGKLSYGWQDIKNAAFEDQRTGLIEADGFVQRRLFRTDHQVGALQLLYAAPVSTRSVFNPPLESGRDAAIQIGARHGWSVGPHFIASSAGYRASLGDDADQFRFDVTFARKDESGRLFLLDVFNTVGLTDAAPGGVDYDLTTLSPSIVLPVTERTQVQIGGGVDLAGRNLDKGGRLFVALWVTIP